MRVNSSASFGFALAALALVLPNTSALAFEKTSETVAATGNVTKASGESREQRAERLARERHRRRYRKCTEGRGCEGPAKEPATMTLLFPAG